jgi:hypothetical protein
MKIYKPCATLLPAITKGRDKPSDLARLEVFSRTTIQEIWEADRHTICSRKKFLARTLYPLAIASVGSGQVFPNALGLKGSALLEIKGSAIGIAMQCQSESLR